MEATSKHIAVWTYLVHPEHVAAFKQAYGPAGAWVRLFQHAKGFVGTELFQDEVTTNRFVTIDCWESRDAWEAFKLEFHEDYKEVDRQCAAYTIEESEIGRFDSLEQAAP